MAAHKAEHMTERTAGHMREHMPGYMVGRVAGHAKAPRTSIGTGRCCGLGASCAEIRRVELDLR
ncbi:hypothetical protein SAMN05216259_103381 [Actinacidiphila guanduensis]|uniref:Uncharacterized protein n=1 Tax=Actinacidiphila guanduensis TaxID=310781 RepID=A0A1H0A0Y5_9ACTN|nr:hypothetical protein SAMN05216259_103381 [Actinacidiphila guanduensis]